MTNLLIIADPSLEVVVCDYYEQGVGYQFTEVSAGIGVLIN
jgi:hypothetical protein